MTLKRRGSCCFHAVSSAPSRSKSGVRALLPTLLRLLTHHLLCGREVLLVKGCLQHVFAWDLFFVPFCERAARAHLGILHRLRYLWSEWTQEGFMVSVGHGFCHSAKPPHDWRFCEPSLLSGQRPRLSTLVPPSETMTCYSIMYHV